ncbi:ABC-F family ATP-binding cassette domain-containing protein [Phyllobacterium sp. YR531]|uniref:ABC-F family ATP-binding cassette domain-containing protein n=1 Tax=Phyllobacterium sp. YR531 TaxID=1144343 RepID=UPI00026F8FF1|nr:ABC-F family ATP-binding cassette domain-containing protein [Phyllobacterium sp. YR531]EJN03622.1 ATPase component of ABC transporters with duplicated ATPase domain [Phyllobacterium sp. YR531]
MSAHLVLQNISYTTAEGRTLFESLDLSLDRMRTGLVGRNGAGKSTLLKLITGEYAMQSGAISQAGSLGVLRQAIQASDTRTIIDELDAAGAYQTIQRMISGTGTLADSAEADWTLESRLAEALEQVGLQGCDPMRNLSTLSGGQRTRVSLAALILKKPDIILLDEPTNNLDRDGRQAVVDFLAQWRGSALVVSHDRQVLRTMDRIVELSSLGLKAYGGNWDEYKQQKDKEVAVADHDLVVAQRNLAELARKARIVAERKARKDSAGKRSRAKAGLSKLILDAREDRAEKTTGRDRQLADRQRQKADLELQSAISKIEQIKPVSFDIGASKVPQGKTVLAFQNVTGGPDEQAPIIQRFSFTIEGGERVAVTGPNGSGKTTLLRLAIGELWPIAGRVHRSGPFAMLDQNVNLLDTEGTVLQSFKRLNPDSTDNDCRAALARFLFRADSALRPVSTLSGGEMLRAGLACVLGGNWPPDLLILDEPTNHLDLMSIAAIETALNAYDGAILTVSHDEDFLSEIGIGRRIALNEVV